MNWRPTRAAAGFTLLELMIVLAVIAILMLLTIPSNHSKVDQTRLAETISLVKSYQVQIASFYQTHHEFPRDNHAAGIPEPGQIIGNYLQAVYVVDGALQLQLGNKIGPQLNGRFISLRPVFVPGSHNSPVSWICGNDAVPDNMVAAGENRTEVAANSLPLSCR